MSRAAPERLGIEIACEIGAGPADLCRWAAAAGCRNISVLPAQLDYNPLGYPYWNLVKSKEDRTELRRALSDCGVSISLGEGFPVMPGNEADDFLPVLDAYAELGIERINVVSMEPDRDRSRDQHARIVEIAAERGMATVIEFARTLQVSSLDEAVDLIAWLGRLDVSILIDTMHFSRCGHQPGDLAAIEPSLIGYVQLCDAPLAGEEQYSSESRYNRLLPGQGELPLTQILTHIPHDVVVSCEIPQLDRAMAGISPADRIAETVRTATSLLSRSAEPTT